VAPADGEHRHSPRHCGGFTVSAGAAVAVAIAALAWVCQTLRTAEVLDFIKIGNIYDDQFVPHNISMCATIRTCNQPHLQPAALQRRRQSRPLHACDRPHSGQAARSVRMFASARRHTHQCSLLLTGTLRMVGHSMVLGALPVKLRSY
jgi:hypothetical protein